MFSSQGAGVRLRMGPRSQALLLFACLVFVPGASTVTAAFAAESGIVFNPGLTTGDRDAGEMLLGELNCVGCHEVSDEFERGLFVKSPPLLGEVGRRLTPQYLMAFLLQPSGYKSGTTMPHLLHSMGQVARETIADELVHFLASLGEPEESKARGDPATIEKGRRLFHQIGCVACHAPLTSIASLSGEVGARESRPPSVDRFVPLEKLPEKMTVEELARFLRDPAAVRPSGRMPSLNLSKGEARAIATYLLREQFYESQRRAQKKRVEGVFYTCYEKQIKKLAGLDLDALKPAGTGVVKNFDIRNRRRNDEFIFRFSGLIEIRRGGEYQFFTNSDDGSLLYIDGDIVVDNDGVHGGTERGGKIQLGEGDHAIEVLMFEDHGGEHLRVSWSGPGIQKQALPSGVLFHIGTPMRPLGAESFELDLVKAGRGERHFASLGCASCHRMGKGEDIVTELKSRPLRSLDPDADGGCLSDRVPAGRPAYGLNRAQRSVLRAALRSFKNRPDGKLAASEMVSRATAAFNCLACHTRDGKGGPAASGRHDFFTCTEGDVMGIEGKEPPPLDGVGAKLRREWLERVLVRQGVMRPFMMTRMPQFGEANVGWLAGAFEAVDDQAKVSKEAASPALSKPAFSKPVLSKPVLSKAVLSKPGHQLVGTDGMSCVSCHRFGKYPSLGIPSVDLMTATSRLKKRWFHDYLLDPQSYRPGSRMPQFWTDGESAQPAILDGDVEEQIDAIWSFLARGQKARIPKGLKRMGEELIVFDEALIYRHWIQGVGTRAIGVGYPERINLAFDAAQVRLALIWQGGFIDAQKHRSGRGAGYEGPLGDAVISFPPGPGIARLSSPDAPWPRDVVSGGPLRFRGYRLDSVRRPTFLYSIGDVEVRDYFVDRAVGAASEFVRRITFSSLNPPSDLWLRLGSSSRFESSAAGVFSTTDGLEIRVEARRGKAVVRTADGGQELLVPILFEGGKAEVREVIRW